MLYIGIGYLLCGGIFEICSRVWHGVHTLQHKRIDTDELGMFMAPGRTIMLAILNTTTLSRCYVDNLSH